MPNAQKPRRKGNSIMNTSNGARFSTTGLSIDHDLSLEEWQEIGGQLFAVERGLNWAIGDWLNFGEAAYGEKYRRVVEQTGRDVQTLMNVAWVASRFDFSRRRETLSWSHHAELAAMDPAEADALLDLAESEGWSRRQVREAVQRRKHELNPATAPPQIDVPALNRAIADQVDALLKTSGMSQREFAEAVYGSPSQQGTVSRIKSGKQRPNLATIERMAETFDVSVDSFGLNPGGQMIPAKAVQHAAEEALRGIEAGTPEGKERALRILRQLSTALVESDL